MRLTNLRRARLIRSIGVLGLAFAAMVSGMAYGQSSIDPTIAFESATEGGTEGQTLEISLIRSPDGSGGASGAATALVGAVFSTGAGRADNADITFFPANVTLSWAAGELGTKTFSVPLVADGVAEGDETFQFQILDVSGQGIVIGSPRNTQVTISDPAPVGPNTLVQFQERTYRGEEGTVVSIVVERVLAAGASLPVGVARAQVEVVPGNADASDVDFNGPTVLNWAAGDTSPKTIPINLFDDLMIEGDEALGLQITGVSGDTAIGSPDATELTIVDINPGELSFFTDSYTVNEAGLTVTLEVTRTGGSDGAVSVDFLAGFNSADDTAFASSDYAVTAPLSGTLNWGDGDRTSQFITYDIALDGFLEPTEQFDVLISNVVGGATIGDDISTVFITDSVAPDPGSVGFASESFTVSESMLTVRLEFIRTGGDDGQVEAFYALGDSGDSADVPDDYAASSPTKGTVTWADGDSDPKFIDVDIVLDSVVDNNEFFTAVIQDTGGGAGVGIEFTEVTITDTPPSADEVRFLVASESVLETVGSFDIVVQRIGTGVGDVDVSFDVITGSASGSATQGDDFDIASTASLFWPNGDLSDKVLPVSVVADAFVEGDETFSVELSIGSGSGNVNLANPSLTTITIEDVVAPVPGELVFNPTTYVVDESGDQLILTVDRIGGTDGAVSADFDFSNSSEPGIAQLGIDFDIADPTGGTLNWADGDGSPKSITLDIVEDSFFEGDESNTATLQNPTGGATIPTGVGSFGTVNIVDNDPAPTPGVLSFFTDSYTVNEAGLTVTLEVTRTGGSDGAVSVDFLAGFNSADDTADASSDYAVSAPLSGTLNWGDGDRTSQFITYDIALDGLSEQTEQFDVLISNAVGGATIGDNVSTVFITDFVAPDPGSVGFASESFTVSESMLTVRLEFIRTGGDDGPVSASYALGDSDDSADEPDDYAASSPTTGSVTWAAGDSDPKFIDVDVVLDNLVEGDEFFNAFILDTTGGAGIGIDSTEVTITDTPPAADEVRFLVASESVLETVGSFDIVVQRIGTGVGEVDVSFDVITGSAIGSATQGDDFDIASTASLFWPDGDLSDKVLPVSVVADALVEGDETFSVELSIGSGSGNVNLGTPSLTTITIEDVGAPMPGTLAFANDQLTVLESAGSITLEIERSGGSDGEISVDFEVLGGDATLGTDHGVTEDTTGTLVFPDGVKSRSIVVDIAADTIVEGNEEFTVELSFGGVSSPVIVDTAFVTIIDTTVPLTPGTLAFINDPYTVSEADGSVSLMVGRSGGSDGELSVDFEVLGGTATLGTDHGVTEELTGTVVFDDGDTTAQAIVVDIATDSLVENSESFSVVLTRNTDLGAETIDTASVTITDNTTPEAITFLLGPTLEVSEDAQTLMLSVQRAGNGVEAVSVLYSIVDGTAIAGEDYGINEPLSGALSWAENDVEDKIIEIDIATDDVIDPDETFLVTLSVDSASIPVSVGPISQAIVTILDVAPPTPGEIEFDPSEYTVAESDGEVEILVTRTGGSDGPASVTYELLSGTATLGDDFEADATDTGLLEWADGDDEPQSIRVILASDDEIEGSEEFTLTLSDVSGATAGVANTATVTLMDSTIPTPDTVVMADAEVDADEDSGTLEVLVQRVGDGLEALSVAYQINDGSAEAGTDFDGEPSGILSWAAGDTDDQSISIDILSDDDVEDVESFTVTLSPDTSSAPVLIGTPDTTTVSITDTTVPPTPDTIALNEAAQSQLESASEFTVVIERSGDGDGASSVNWAVSAGTASLSDDIDLEPLTGSVSWDDGDTGPLSVSIPIINDELDEPDETLSFTLISAQGADLGGLQTSTLTIVDDDEPPVPGTIQFLADTFTVNEDAGSVTLAVSRVGGDDGDITAVVTSVAGSASDNDFEAIQTVLTWSDSDSDNQEFVIPINFDTEAENTESFAVVLGNATPDDSVLGTPAMATVVINDVFNGEPGTVQFVSDALSVDETDEELTISVSRTGGSDGALSVNFATSAGSATSGEDFASTSGTLTWEDGDGSPKSFTVAIVADSVSEESELFSATLSDATPFGDESIGAPATVEITINNVEPTPEPEPEPAPEPGTVQFVSDTATVDESAGTISVSVARTGGSDGAVSVSYESIGGSAVAGDDFEPISGQLQWADGEDDVRILTIAIRVDDLVEVDEQFQVVLNNALPDETVLGEPATLNLTIADDSVAPPGVLAFTTTAVTVAEADSIVELQVSRTEGSAGEVSVGYTTIARSADEADFQATSGRLYWADGDDSLRTIVVPVNRDGLVESEEQFQVALAQAEPFGDSEQLGTALATVSITDSTRLGSLAFASNEVVVVTESQGSVTLAVTRTDGSDGAVSVDYSLVGGSAVLGADVVDQSGTLNWSDQDTEPKTIELQINEDDLVESREQFVVSLSNAQPLGAQQIARAQATVVIIDSTIFEDTSTPPLASLGALDLVVVSGDGQGGLPGDLLEPLVIDVIDQADSDALVSNIPITWRAIPEGSAELLESDRTVSDDMGRTSNRMRIVSRGFLRVVATIDVEPQATSGIASRNLPPPFEVGQGEAVFTIRSGIGPAIGLRANQAAIGNTLDVVCEVLSVRISQQQVVTAEQQDLFETCLEVEARLADDDGLAAALDRLVPEELFALGDSIIDTTDIQVTNIYSRINAIRSGQVDLLDVSGLQFNYYDQSIPGSVIEASQDELSGGSASADESIGESSRIGFFANGSISYGEVEGGENQSDAEIRTSGLTIGADYRASDNTVFGVGFGFVTSKTDFNPDAGSADIDGLNLSLFGTYYEPNKSYIDAVLDFGRNNYDIERRINLPNTPDQFGIGDTTANVQSLTIGAGRDYRHETWEFGPYGRLSILQADIDGYSERAAGSTDGFGSVLNIGSHSVTSSRLAVGGQVAKTISTKRGVFIPQFRAEAEFEREERKDGIQATFQHDPTQTPFTVNGDDRDSSYFNLGIGGSALFPNGRSGFLFYETQLGNDRVTQHWLKLGVRLEF